MIEVMAFKCSYCSMTSLTKGTVVRHEKRSCRKNPARKTCFTCAEWCNDWGEDYGCTIGAHGGVDHCNEETKCTRYKKIDI